MAEITNFPTPVENETQNSSISRGELKELQETVTSLFSEDSIQGSALHSLGALLSMTDGEFMLLAPGVLQSFQQSVNNPNDKIILAQALGAIGSNTDELTETFANLSDEIDSIDTLSAPKKEFLRSVLATIVNAIIDTEGISKRLVQVPVEICREGAKLPQYANTSDSGMDLFALEDYTINPGETKLIPTGIKLALPPGYEVQVRPKSGRSLKTKLRVANTPGTVDAGYRDEICVILENIEPPLKDISYHYDDNGHLIIDSILHGSSYSIGKGEKFAQLVLSEVPKIALYEVEKVSEIGENRGGGFGSTGLK
jgi:dUTP pyrophosphatase